MNTDKATTAINAAVIVIGSYHVPYSVAFGSLVGASLFILSRQAESAISKAWLFAIAFFGGLFGYDGAEQAINWALPGDTLHINTFTAAALFSALIVIILQNLIKTVSGWPPKISLPGKEE